MDPYKILCALNGVAPLEAEISGASEDGIPLGWTRISFEVAYPNPRKMLIRELMKIDHDQKVASLPKELNKEQRIHAKRLMRVATDAAFFAINEATPEVLTQTEEFYLAPADRFPNVVDALARVQEALGIPQSEVPEAEDPDSAA